MSVSSCGKAKIAVGAAGALAAAGLGLGLYFGVYHTGPAYSGTETFRGIEHLTSAEAASGNYVPMIPMTARGAFSDTGSLRLTPGSGPNGNGPGPATMVLSKGDISVQHGATPGNGQPEQVGDGCRFSVTQETPYTFTGGTGTYADATGHGIATVTFEFTMPVLATHVHPVGGPGPICDTSSGAVPLSGAVTFRAAGPVTVP